MAAAILMTPPRCLVLAHVYHPDVWEEIARHLHRLGEAAFDLCVNVVQGRAPVGWSDGLRREFAGAQVFDGPNLGQDIGGTVNVLSHVDLSRYDLVCKIHTKMSQYAGLGGAEWRDDLLRACLDDPREIFRLFQRPEVMMVGSATHIVTGMGRNLSTCRWLCGRLGLDGNAVYAPFVAGSMFWCRPSIMQRIKDLGLALADFRVAYAPDGTLAHAIERVFGSLARSQGELVGR